MTPDEVEAIRERVEAATPGPWFYDSYSRVQSAPLVQEWDPWSDPLVDAGHELKRYGKCEACVDWPLPDGRSPQLGAGCRHATEAYQRDPDVASVPPLAGDTATGRHAADAQFIAHARTDVPALLAALAEAQRERDDERAKVEALLLGDKALQPRIWLGEEVQRLKAQLAEAQRREELMRPVVEKAQAIKAARGNTMALADAYWALADALDTYETQTGGTE